MMIIVQHLRKVLTAAVLTAVVFSILSCYVLRSTDRPNPERSFWRSFIVNDVFGMRSLTPRENLTVVTAYFNLGKISKGSVNSTRGPAQYHQWMKPYKYIRNAVVAYFDDNDIAAYFEILRKGLPTKVVMVERSQTWAFSMLERTQSVFSQPTYPKNHPKSTNAAYVCAMHAKYELVADAVRENTFASAYFAWMDVGIYRTLPENSSEGFTVMVPACHHDQAVMFAKIYNMNHLDTATSVLRTGLDWVGGGFFLAKADVMVTFCEDYKRYAEDFLKNRLANHDQSVILAMYLPTQARRPAVPLQAVLTLGSTDPWFAVPLRVRSDGLQALSSSALSWQQHACSYELYK